MTISTESTADTFRSPLVSYWNSHLETSKKKPEIESKESKRAMKSLFHHKGRIPDITKKENADYLGPPSWQFEHLNFKELNDQVKCRKLVTTNYWGQDFNFIFCHPPSMDDESIKKIDACVIFHNPLGVTVSDYLTNWSLGYAPKKIMELMKCPIILFDYDGIGMNRRETKSKTDKINFFDLAICAKLIYIYINTHFSKIHLWGSGIGANVAVYSLFGYSRTISTFNKKNVTLTLVDGLHSKKKVYKTTVELVNILCNSGVEVTAILRTNDTLLPIKKQLAFVLNREARNIEIIIAGSNVHGHLCDELIEKLKLSLWNKTKLEE